MPITKNGEIIVQDFRGINVKDTPFDIDETECQIATNVVVTGRSVEVRGGFQLHSEDVSRTGGIPMMNRYYKRDGTAQLVFANDDDYYYITPSNVTWQTIGDYGTSVDNLTAFQYKDILVFGTGSTSNTPKKWDGSSFTNITTPASSSGDLRFYAQFAGQNIRYITGAGNSEDDATDNITTLYYTDDPDDWSSGGNVQVGPQDGQDITGLIQNNNLVVYKEKAKHYWDSFYEENTGTFALREFGIAPSSGSVNHETLIPIDGDIVTPAGKGLSIEGFGLEGTAQGNARPKQYATYINPILDNINWQKSIVKKSRGKFFDRKCFFSMPFNGSQYNNIMLVGHWDSPTKNGQPSWTTWSRSAGALEIFRDEDGVDQFYISDPLQPKIYVYDKNIYSDNGFGYRRLWRSKKFTLGRRPDYNKMLTVIVAGYMRTITEFTLKVIVDGRTQEYIIDSEQLVESGGVSGAHIGDRLIGDEVIGGNSAEGDKFRYLAVAQIPNSLRYCKNVEVEISNEEPGQYWSLDYLSINEKLDYANIPDNHKNLRTT